MTLPRRQWRRNRAGSSGASGEEIHSILGQKALVAQSLRHGTSVLVVHSYLVMKNSYFLGNDQWPAVALRT